MHDDTSAIRIQADRSRYGEHAVPIYMTSGYVFESAGEASEAFAGENDHPLYGRFDNPNTDEFAAKMAVLEGTEGAVATSSGMSAIVTSVLGLLRAGDHVVGSVQVFGSTLSLLKEFLPRWGIETTLVDLTDLEAWEKACRPNTRMFLLETPSNPGLDLVDLSGLSEIAHSRGILVNVDNCFATPVLQKPVTFGADIVVHSATKFIDGQGRVLGGVIASSREILGELMPFYRTLGPTLSAFNGWVLSRSLETLAIRMERHCTTAEQLARRLQELKGIGTVRYPGLPSHSQYDIARRQMSRPGALFTVEVGTSASDAMAFMDRLQIISRSVNLGDTRTIATHPYTTTHRSLPEELKQQLGIHPNLVRISVGLEDPEDLWIDMERALTG
jgi:O-succinylhomoserine sulfhydrylase